MCVKRLCSFCAMGAQVSCICPLHSLRCFVSSCPMYLYLYQSRCFLQQCLCSCNPRTHHSATNVSSLKESDPVGSATLLTLHPPFIMCVCTYLIYPLTLGRGSGRGPRSTAIGSAEPVAARSHGLPVAVVALACSQPMLDPMARTLTGR